jgi:hypothetical protein
MPSRGPIFGKTPSSQLFASNIEGSGNKWQDWQYLAANLSPFFILEINTSLWLLFRW